MYISVGFSWGFFLVTSGYIPVSLFPLYSSVSQITSVQTTIKLSCILCENDTVLRLHFSYM